MLPGYTNKKAASETWLNHTRAHNTLVKLHRIIWCFVRKQNKRMSNRPIPRQLPGGGHAPLHILVVRLLCETACGHACGRVAKAPHRASIHSVGKAIRRRYRRRAHGPSVDVGLAFLPRIQRHDRGHPAPCSNSDAMRKARVCFGDCGGDLARRACSGSPCILWCPRHSSGGRAWSCCMLLLLLLLRLLLLLLRARHQRLHKLLLRLLPGNWLLRLCPTNVRCRPIPLKRLRGLRRLHGRRGRR
mmetsp:Transcript_94637/g.271449  ORF Transcript_94637/g.271449 Transcript_94637/m.271449 type:complete len:244 (+) Transcript_94637:34-765(+)